MRRIKLTFIAPATYFSHLIPTSSTIPPSTIATYLTHANLPPQTLALAASLLDSLSSSFPRAWRAALLSTNLSTLSPPPLPTPISGPSSPTSSLGPLTPLSANSNSHPELATARQSRPVIHRTRQSSSAFLLSLPPPPAEAIFLASLKISASFLEDYAKRNLSWWTEYVCEGRVNERTLEATVRCVLQDVEWDLCAIAERESVERWRRVMFKEA
jgi:hypothetical protein